LHSLNAKFFNIGWFAPITNNFDLFIIVCKYTN